ncbi:PAS domain S-box protein [Granulosicoccus antarcticus]|uniref:histidine kinase n=1 Tax=Granulosicoccus antarcticus IMCC3135 TaxID=1192854 RepID=A0A2Z2P178_9GAMM|nr:PAS domain S-box protein [Granulosicoccus antarcticus]ASJ73294.1 Blue-light-activated protein [Granulosicoccus antarcticus IMCC3135]
MTQLTVSLKELPLRKFLQVAPDTLLSEAARQMDNDGLDTALVMQGQNLLGILGSRDRLRAFHQQTPPNTPVRELMNSAHCSLKQNTFITDACSHLLQHAASELVITNELGMPLGLIGESELLQYITPFLTNDTQANKDWVLQHASKRMEADKQLHTLKRQTDLLSRFAAALINLPADDIDPVVNHALMEMGELVQVDRAYIFHYDFDTDTACNTHEWCASGISPQIHNLQVLPIQELSDWVCKHKRSENVVVDDFNLLPPGMMREVMEQQDIKSMVCLPILGNEGCIGFLGFDSVRSKRQYAPEDLEVLELFARTLANYRERLIAEQKLANNEANFHAFFDQTQDLLFVLSQQGDIVQCNTQATQRLGFSMEELYGKPVLQLHPDENHTEAAQIVADMAKGKTDCHAIPMQTRFGQQVPMETRVVAGQWNGIPALFMVCRDLSDITSSEEKFSKAFHLSPMPMAISDVQNGTFLEVNEAFFHVTGYDTHEVVGKNVAAMNLFGDLKLWGHIIEQLQQQGQVNNIEFPLRTKQGDIVYGLLSAALLELQGRQVMISQLLDITARKTAEEALVNERLLLRTLINSQLNLVWLKDPEGAYLACNSRFESLYGHTESEILGRTDIEFVNQEWAEFFRKNDHLAIKAGKPRINEETLTFASNGYQGLFETTKTPIFNGQQKLLGVLGVAREITHARHAEQERRRMERELHQSRKMEALGQLTGGVAHEFNNMLAIILGYKDLLQAKLDPSTDSSINIWLDHIDVAGVRAKELVRQLLSFSRPNEKQPKRINLEIGVRKAIALSQSSLPSSIEIDYRPDPELPDVQLDIGELQQMLTNVLVNARDAMDGKGRIEVTLQHTRHTEQECQLCHTLIEGYWVELCIADDGPGIFPEQLSRIFEPFYTTKAVGKGTGLGLSLVHSIMEHNGGHILLDSRPGEGTRFCLLFRPLDDEALKSIPMHTPVETPSLKAGRVLVVDDEPALTEFLKETLELQGLQVIALNDSREALDLLLEPEQQFDLLITDQTMPGMLGTELATQAKNHLGDLKVILCTGHSEQINADNAAEFGIDSFLKKPIGIQDIVIAIDNLSK